MRGRMRHPRASAAGGRAAAAVAGDRQIRTPRLRTERPALSAEWLPAHCDTPSTQWPALSSSHAGCLAGWRHSQKLSRRIFCAVTCEPTDARLLRSRFDSISANTQHKPAHETTWVMNGPAKPDYDGLCDHIVMEQIVMDHGIASEVSCVSMHMSTMNMQGAGSVRANISFSASISTVPSRPVLSTNGSKL